MAENTGAGTDPAAGPAPEHALRVVESMTSGVVTLDPEGRVTAINQRAAQIIGAEPGALMGETLITILLEDPNNEHLTDAIVEASYDATGRYHRQVEYHSGDRRRVLDLRANLLRGADGVTDERIIELASASGSGDDGGSPLGTLVAVGLVGALAGAAFVVRRRRS